MFRARLIHYCSLDSNEWCCFLALLADSIFLFSRSLMSFIYIALRISFLSSKMYCLSFVFCAFVVSCLAVVVFVDEIIFSPKLLRKSNDSGEWSKLRKIYWSTWENYSNIFSASTVSYHLAKVNLLTSNFHLASTR